LVTCFGNRFSVFKTSKHVLALKISVWLLVLKTKTKKTKTRETQKMETG